MKKNWLCTTAFFASTLMLYAMWLALLPSFAVAASNNIVVFAAASTTNALTDIAALYAKEGGEPITFSFGSSSTLAKQIGNGAPADIIISANTEWVDYLEEKNQIEQGTRFDLLGNRLVLIAPSSSTIPQVEMTTTLNMARLLGSDGRLAMGDPAHVPAGIYGKKALEHFGIWKQVENSIAPAKDVRAGLALVERGECPLGIVYASDAALVPTVRVIGVFPASSHPAITYPIAIIRGHTSAKTLAFIAYLRTNEAKNIWKKYGFEVH